MQTPLPQLFPPHLNSALVGAGGVAPAPAPALEPAPAPAPAPGVVGVAPGVVGVAPLGYGADAVTHTPSVHTVPPIPPMFMKYFSTRNKNG